MITHHITTRQLRSGACIQIILFSSILFILFGLPIAGQQRLSPPLRSLLSIFLRMLLILIVSASGSTDLPFPNHQTQPLESDSDTYTTQSASLGSGLRSLGYQTSDICSSFTLCCYS